MDTEKNLADQQWAYFTGIAKTSGGNTTLCFSRKLASPAARVAPNLKVWAQPPPGGNSREFGWSCAPKTRTHTHVRTHARTHAHFASAAAAATIMRGTDQCM